MSGPSSCDTRIVPRWAGWMQSALLFVVLVIVGVRPLIPETHDTGLPPLSAALTGLQTTTPLTTGILDLVVIIAAGLTAILCAAGYLPRRARSGLAMATALLAVGALLSLSKASNFRLAMTASVDWLCGPLVAMVLAALIQTQRQRVLTLAVLLAGGVATAIYCHDQIWVELPATRAHYFEGKSDFWTRQGVALDAAQVTLFERRLNDPRGATGFYAFSNVAASYLLLPLFVAVGLAWAARRLMIRLLATAAVVIMGSAMYWTGSRGAIAGGCAALVLAAVYLGARRLCGGNASTALRVTWGVIGAVALSAGGYAWSAGGFPDGSLTFRWWYLEASVRMFASSPLVGVGSAQYGRHFTHFKEIKCPEEIMFPHNFVANAACSWGLLGLLGIGVGLWSGVRTLARGPVDQGIADVRGPPPTTSRGLQATMIAVTAAVFMLRTLIVGYSDLDYIIATTTFPLIGWIVTLTLCAAAEPTRLDTARAWWCVGLVAFLAHNLLTFALFIPGPQTTFFALLGLALATTASRPGATVRAPRPVRVLALSAVTVMAGVVVVVFVVAPLARTRPLLERARSLAAHAPEQAAEYYRRAGAADPSDPTPIREGLELALATGRPAGVSDQDLILRDSANTDTYRLIAALRLRHDDPASLEQAFAAYGLVIQRYPSSPDDHLRHAAIADRLYALTSKREMLEAAVTGYGLALELNARRAADEIRRFTPEQVAAIEHDLERLHALRAPEPLSTP